MLETVSMEVLTSGIWKIYLHDINGVRGGGLLEFVQSIRPYGTVPLVNNEHTLVCPAHLSLPLGVELTTHLHLVRSSRM